MTTKELLAELQNLGVGLAGQDGRLKIDAPSGVITPAIRAELALHKTELLTLLAGDAQSDLDRRLDALETGIADREQRIDKLATDHGLDTLAPQATETAPDPTFPDNPLAAGLTAPPWAGQRVRIDELDEFKRRYGLQTVGSEWPEGQPFPVVGLAEVRKHDKT